MMNAPISKTNKRTELLPQLEAGDRLTRPEFHRRYCAMPYLKKAELVEGIVYLQPRVTGHHGTAHAQLGTAFGTYVAATPAIEIADNSTIMLDADNEVQPDILLRLDRGSSYVRSDGYIEGAPEFVAEIAASSASYDLHDKMHVYRRNGVQEYLVWQIYDERIDWFCLSKGRYQVLPADDSGIIRSQIFPGLHLNTSALLQGDMPAVVAKRAKWPANVGAWRVCAADREDC